MLVLTPLAAVRRPPTNVTIMSREPTLPSISSLTFERISDRVR